MLFENLRSRCAKSSESNPLPKYETNQRMIGFIKRLPAEFGGFNSQMIPMSGDMVQMLHGQMQYKGTRIFLALFTRPRAKFDTAVMSLPLFHIPEDSQEPVFEQLLDWNNGATESVHFALDELLNTVNLVCVRPVEGMPFQEFQHCINNLVAVRLNAAPRLQSEFGITVMGQPERI